MGRRGLVLEGLGLKTARFLLHLDVYAEVFHFGGVCGHLSGPILGSVVGVVDQVVLEAIASATAVVRGGRLLKVNSNKLVEVISF